ncbi:MAG: hypothetical protein ACREXU_12885 [Gammaproteobacteria bacterium]
MSDPTNKRDLREIQDRLNRSREQFIEELEAHDADAGSRLVDEFLNEQLGPSEKRSPIAQREAKEAVQLIRGFNNHAVSIAGWVAIASLTLEQAALSLQVDAIREGREDFGRLGGRANFGKAAEDISRRAVQCGEHIDFVQRLSTVVLLAHRSTILEFTAEALDVRWDDVVSRIRRELANSTKSELFDQSYDLLKEQLMQLAKDISEEYLDGLRKYWRLARRLIGKKNIPTFGKTDVMQRLLHELREQERTIAQLESAYNSAFQVLQSQTSGGPTS